MIAEDSMNIFALQFKMNWNTNMESVVFNNQGEFWCTLKINSDWGAMLSLTSQYAVNQAIPLREYQLICISTRASKEHLLVNGRTTVLNDNIDFHFWGQHGLTLSSDCFMSYHALRFVLCFHEKRGDRVWVVQLFTDQCAEQYKSRLTSLALMMLAYEFNLIAIFQAYSATSDGKGAHDGSAGAGASVKRDLMTSGSDIFNCAWDTFLVIEDKMGQPDVPKDDSRLPHGLTQRKHVFFIDEKDVVAYEKLPQYASRAAAMRARSGVDGDVMILNSSYQNRWDASPVNGIMSISQLIVLKRNPDKRFLITDLLDMVKRREQYASVTPSTTTSPMRSSSTPEFSEMISFGSRDTYFPLQADTSSTTYEESILSLGGHPMDVPLDLQSEIISMEPACSNSSLTSLSVVITEDIGMTQMISSPSVTEIDDFVSACGKSSTERFFGRDDPTEEYILFSRKYPCPCSWCRNLDFTHCEFIDQVGTLKEEPIHYIPAKAPAPLALGVEESFAFFDGPISTADEARLLLIRPSLDEDFILAILSSPPKRVDKRTVQDIPAQGPVAAQQIVWNAGEVQIKAKLLTKYIDAQGEHSGYYCAVNTPVKTLNIECLILPPTHADVDTNRENYLNFDKTRTGMRRNNKLEYRDVFRLAEASINMINVILGR